VRQGTPRQSFPIDSNHGYAALITLITGSQLGAAMDDERELRGSRHPADIVAALGCFGLFMVFTFIGMVFCHEVFGCDRTSSYLIFWGALCSLLATMLMATGRYGLAAAALGLVEMPTLVLSSPLLALVILLLTLAVVTLWRAPW
jgi:hypothetical protein